MIRITFEAKNYVSLCEELKLFLSYSNIPTTKEPPTAPVVPATVQAPPVAPVAQPAPVAPVVPTSAPLQAHPDPMPTHPDPVPTHPDPMPTHPDPVQAPPTPAVPVAPVKEYTLEEIQVALQPLMDAGRTNEIVGLMQKYKVASLPELPKDHFPSLVVDLRNMGARI